MTQQQLPHPWRFQHIRSRYNNGRPQHQVSIERADMLGLTFSSGWIDGEFADVPPALIAAAVAYEAALPAQAPVEDWTGLPERWNGQIIEFEGRFYATARSNACHVAGKPHPTHDSAIASIPAVINAVRCLEGLPVTTPARELTDADLPEGYGIYKNSMAEKFCFTSPRGAGAWWPTREQAIQDAIRHAQAWEEADRG